MMVSVTIVALFGSHVTPQYVNFTNKERNKKGENIFILQLIPLLFQSHFLKPYKKKPLIEHKTHLFISQSNGDSPSHQPSPPNNYLDKQQVQKQVTINKWNFCYPLYPRKDTMTVIKLTCCLNVIGDALCLFIKLEKAESGNTKAARPTNISKISVLQMPIEAPKLQIKGINGLISYDIMD